MASPERQNIIYLPKILSNVCHFHYVATIDQRSPHWECDLNIKPIPASSYESSLYSIHPGVGIQFRDNQKLSPLKITHKEENKILQLKELIK